MSNSTPGSERNQDQDRKNSQSAQPNQGGKQGGSDQQNQGQRNTGTGKQGSGQGDRSNDPNRNKDSE